MHPNEITEVLNRPISQELLTRDVTRLAYVAKDGTPRSVPIGFTWNGSQIVMCTAKNAQHPISPNATISHDRPHDSTPNCAVERLAPGMERAGDVHTETKLVQVDGTGFTTVDMSPESLLVCR